MTQHVPRILVVGAVVADLSCRLNFNLSTDHNLDKKVDAIHLEPTLGGGGGNCAIALKLLDRAFSAYTHVEFDTRIGNPPEGDIVANISDMIIRKGLEQNQIRYKDVTHGPSHNSLNALLNHAGGRLLVRDPYATTGDLEPGYQDTIANDVHGSDVVFVDPKKRRMGLAAVLAAKEQKKHCIVDWGQDSWPADHEEAAMCDGMLRNASVIIVPDDAIVAGMTKKSPDDLFERLKNYYGAPNILMSNGAKSVRFLIDGKEGMLTTHIFSHAVDTNAAGDTRNAGVLWALSRGLDMRSAFDFGTAIASSKITYPGLTWVDHVVSDLESHPRVAPLLEQLRPIQGPQPSQTKG